MERCADPSTKSEVDDAILDYLLFTATKVTLDETKLREAGQDGARNQARADLPLQMVDSFLLMHRSMHPDRLFSEEMSFRRRLLKFSRLFTTRSMQPNASTSGSASRSTKPKDHADGKDFKNGQTIDGYLVSSLPIGVSAPIVADKLSTADSTESAPSLSLLATLPSFMAISATHISLQDIRITPAWMRLAAGYMAHAAIEKFLLYGTRWPEILQEAFAYGFDPESDASEGSDKWSVNAMFFDDNAAVAGWEEIRRDHLDALSPGPGVDLRGYLEGLLGQELPLATFEKDVIGFLKDLLFAHPKPFLVQVEAGKVDGFSRRGTKEVKSKARWEGY